MAALDSTQACFHDVAPPAAGGFAGRQPPVRRSGPGRRPAPSAARWPAAVAALVGLALVATACSSEDEGPVPAQEARELLENRNWLDAWPGSKDDRLRVYRFTPDMGGGVFQDRTLYRGQFELFNYDLSDEHVEFRFPDADEKLRTRYRIERVDGPKPFDLRLVLERSPRGPSIYYGLEAERGEAGDLFDPRGLPAP